MPRAAHRKPTGRRPVRALIAAGGAALTALLALAHRRPSAAKDRDQAYREAAARQRLHAARQLHDLATERLNPAAAPVTGPETYRRDPRAIAFTTDASRCGRAELRHLLAPLAPTGAPPGGSAGVAGDAPTGAPTGGLAELDALLAPLADAGTPVQVEIRGEVRPLLPGIDLTAHHVVREALRAAPASAVAAYRLLLNFRPAALVVQVIAEPYPAARRRWQPPIRRRWLRTAPVTGGPPCTTQADGVPTGGPAAGSLRTGGPATRSLPAGGPATGAMTGGPDLADLRRQVALYGGQVTTACTGPNGTGLWITVRLPIHNGPVVAQPSAS